MLRCLYMWMLSCLRIWILGCLHILMLRCLYVRMLWGLYIWIRGCLVACTLGYWDVWLPPDGFRLLCRVIGAIKARPCAHCLPAHQCVYPPTFVCTYKLTHLLIGSACLCMYIPHISMSPYAVTTPRVGTYLHTCLPTYWGPHFPPYLLACLPWLA
jgi:hypothetical protein